jgi:hypothetical protein
MGSVGFGGRSDARRGGVRRQAFLVISGVAVGAVIAGGSVALADAGSPPGAGYVSITPVKIASNTSVAKGTTLAKVAIGGTTTVPTNATAVRLSVTARSTVAGALEIFPAGDPMAAGATTIAMATTATTQTVTETVGVKDEIAFVNTTAGTATLTASITGYSTQLTASNVAGDGGVAGQVLTNNGSGGASWGAGGVTVNTGSGLTGGGSIALGGSRTLGVDSSQVQSRITGGCSGDSAIASVNQSGSVNCQATGVKTIAGAVSASGDVAAGSGFTVTHPNPGEYLVTFPTGTWTGLPLMTVTPWGVSGQYVAADVFFVSVPGNGAATFTIHMSSTVGAQTLTDNGFMFTAVRS